MTIKPDSIIKKYRPGKREDLIPLLQEIEEQLGFLSEEAIVLAGKHLGLSTTKIYGLATFYDQFRFIPRGRIHIRICNGTSCYLNGSRNILGKLKEVTGIIPGQTTRDGLISYEVVTCMGGCTNGPVIQVNGEFRTSVKPEQIPDLVSKLKYIIEND
jgi:NADH-quinone oxidoreductase subunit E